MFQVAWRKSSTCTMAALGSTTRKNTTALTRTVTLSRVMASWEGTSSVTTRRSTFTMRSMMGMMKNNPGPRAPTRRPKRKITPRSYSWTILIAEPRSAIRKRTRIKTGRLNRLVKKPMLNPPIGRSRRSLELIILSLRPRLG